MEVIMKIIELFKMQAEMEKKMSKLSGVEENSLGDHNIMNVRFLAIQVKLGELANLTKCYKYKKDINEIPRTKILFRYLEGMRYLLSIGNKYELNIIDDYAFDNIEESEDLIILFTDLYDGLSKLKTMIKNDRFVDGLNLYIFIFAKYIQLARALQISYEEAYSYFMDNSISA